MAGSTGLEPAASGVTGRRSNQLNYDPERALWSTFAWLAESKLMQRYVKRVSEGWWAVQDSNL